MQYSRFFLGVVNVMSHYIRHSFVLLLYNYTCCFLPSLDFDWYCVPTSFVFFTFLFILYIILNIFIYLLQIWWSGFLEKMERKKNNVCWWFIEFEHVGIFGLYVTFIYAKFTHFFFKKRINFFRDFSG